MVQIPKCDGMLNIVYKSYKAIMLGVVNTSILIIGKHNTYTHKFQMNLIFSIKLFLLLHINTDFIQRKHRLFYWFLELIRQWINFGSIS